MKLKLLFLYRRGHIIHKQITGDIIHHLGNVQEGKIT